MNDNRKQKLIELGPETLAEALLDLSIHSDEADDLIERLGITTVNDLIPNRSAGS